MLDYREYIYAVYQEQSFSKAALKLHVAQPWLSRTIKNEECKLKCLLFDRSTTPISLTEEGKYYISQIQKVMDIEKEMETHFSALEEAAAPPLFQRFFRFPLPWVMDVFPRWLMGLFRYLDSLSISISETNCSFESLS